MSSKYRLALWMPIFGVFISVISTPTVAVLVSGDLASQTWSAIDNPFELVGDVTVLGGSTLNVESNSVIVAAPIDSAGVIVKSGVQASDQAAT